MKNEVRSDEDECWTETVEDRSFDPERYPAKKLAERSE